MPETTDKEAARQEAARLTEQAEALLDTARSLMESARPRPIGADDA